MFFASDYKIYSHRCFYIIKYSFYKSNFFTTEAMSVVKLSKNFALVKIFHCTTMRYIPYPLNANKYPLFIRVILPFISRVISSYICVISPLHSRYISPFLFLLYLIQAVLTGFHIIFIN